MRHTREEPVTSEQPIRRGRLHRLSRIAVMLVLVLLALLLIFVLGVFLIDTVGIEGALKAQSVLDAVFFPLFLWRVCLYGFILYRWQAVTRWFARRGGWSEAELEFALGRRNEMAVYLLLFELVVTGTFLLRVLS